MFSYVLILCHHAGYHMERCDHFSNWLPLHNSQIKRSPKVVWYLCSVCIHIYVLQVEWTTNLKSTVSLWRQKRLLQRCPLLSLMTPFFEGNETFTADLSVPVAEAALGVSVSATDGTAYVEIQDDGKQNPLHMHVIVGSPWSPLIFIQTWLTSHPITCPTRWLKAVAMSQ